MKKLTALLLATLLLISLAACGGDDDPNSKPGTNPVEQTTTIVEEPKDAAAILAAITADFDSVTEALTQSMEETFTAVGTTYADYVANKGLVDEWITEVLTESDNLFARTRENSIAYFKQIAADPKHEDSDFCSDSLDDYYDTVYDDAMDTYYDCIYDDAMDALYDRFYDGVIDDAYDTEEIAFDEWSDVSGECYDTWSEASSAVYDQWANGQSYAYDLWFVFTSAFCYDNNFDVDAIVAAYEQEKAADEEELANRVEFDALYEVNADGSATVVGYSGEGNYITIGAEYEGHAVLKIAKAAFQDCTTLKDIQIWASLEEIGDYAFSGCTGLTEISIPFETTIIGNHAFEGCSSLSNLTIWGSPDIGEYAFVDCTALTEISIGSDTKGIGNHAFEGCTGVTSLTIWDVEIIGDYAFADCTGIESVSIPTDAKSIGNHAFDGCSALTSVTIWDDDTAIGKDAFANCPKLSDVPASRGTVIKFVLRADDTTDGENTGEIRADFKAAMDSYEAFYDEYCEILKKYQQNPTDLTLLNEYSQMLTELSEMQQAFAAWEDEDLNDAELAYYLEVSNRITQKLLDITQ